MANDNKNNPDPFEEFGGTEKESFTGERTREVKVDANVSKCPTCGANLVYSPARKKLHCEYCGTDVSVDLTDFAEEIPFSELLKSAPDWKDETRVFACKNCGARTIVSKKDIAPVCPYCGTKSVVEESDLVGLKPNAVLPFLIDDKAAAEKFKKWAKRKLYAPRKYKKNVRPEQIRGNYFPAFTFDSDTFSTYNGRLGEYYYVTVRRNGKTYQERRVRYYSISGTYSRFFNDVLVYANKSRDEKRMNKLLPFATDYAQKYNEDFIYGFGATQYEKDGTECWSEAQARMRSAVQKAILSQYVYDFVDYLNVDTAFGKVTYKYMLLPVYIGHSKYNGKLYNFYVNGQNGNVAGKSPVSPVKVLFTVLIGLAALAGIGVLLYFLLR